MTIGKKLGDLPTMKVDPEELARIVRDAEERLRESDGARETARPPADFADLEISVDVDEIGEPPLVEGPRPAALARPESVPFVVASREDLAWFELDEPSRLVLELIDGMSSVDSIRLALALPVETTLATLGELASLGIIEFL